MRPSGAAGELIKMAQIKWLHAPGWSSWAVALFGQLAQGVFGVCQSVNLQKVLLTCVKIALRSFPFLLPDPKLKDL